MVTSCMIYGIGVWYMIYDIWCRFMIYGMWYMVYDIGYTVYGKSYMVGTFVTANRHLLTRVEEFATYRGTSLIRKRQPPKTLP